MLFSFGFPGIYLQFMTTIACITAAATAIQIHIAFGDGPVSHWIEKLFLHTFPRFACLKWLQSKYQHRFLSSITKKSPKEFLAKNAEEIMKLVTIDTRLTDATTEKNMDKCTEENNVTHTKDNTDVSTEDTNISLKHTNTESTIDTNTTTAILPNQSLDNNCKKQLKRILRKVETTFDQFITKQSDNVVEDRERQVRLHICHVVDRFLFYLFFGIIMIVTVFCFSFLIIGSIHEFNYLKETLSVSQA